MELKHRALSGAVWSGLASLSSIALQFLQLILLGRILSPDQFGLSAMAAVVVGIANAYADVGLSNAILTHHGLSRTALSSLYWLNWGASVLAGGSIFLLAPTIALAFGDARVSSLIAWSALGFAFAPLGLQFQLLLQRELQMRPIALIEVVSGAAGVTVAILSGRAGAGAISLVYGNLVALGMRSVMFFAVGFQKWPPVLTFVPREIRPLIGFGLYQLGERTLNTFARNVDKMLVGALLGAHALGFYNVAYQLMQKPVEFFYPVLARVLTPMFSLIGESDDRLKRSYLSLVRIMGLALFPVFAFMAFFAEPLLALLMGALWKPAAGVLSWLSALGALFAIGVPSGSLLLARKRADIAFWLNVWALFVFSSAVVIGASYGAIGVAAALFAAQVLGLVSIGFWVRWKLIRMMPMEFIEVLQRTALSAVTTAALGHLAAELVGLENGTLDGLMFGTIVGGLVVVLLYSTAIWAFERRFVLELWQLFCGWRARHEEVTNE